MARITPSDVTPTIVERIVILCITVIWSTSVVSRKFGAVIGRNEWLIESSPRRRPLWRGEVRVVFVPAGIGLLRVSPERVLVLGTDGVGRAGWVLELFVVAEDDEEEEGGEAEFDEEGENVRPSASVPCSITPCRERF